MSIELNYYIKTSDSPIWSFSIHDGHHIDEDLLPYLLVDESLRLREEDPYTALIGELPVNQFVVGTSRFQLDLNRSIAESVYLHPEKAWGLDVWEKNIPSSYLELLYKKHRDTYHIISAHIESTIKKYGFFIVLDIHSYNSKRLSKTETVDTVWNPQINLGTYFIKPKWRHLTDYLIDSIRSQHLYNEAIDIRENIKFKGGYLSQFLNEQYGDKGCVFAIEFRKDFMDEWSGEPDVQRVACCKQLLINSVQALKDYLEDE